MSGLGGPVALLLDGSTGLELKKRKAQGLQVAYDLDLFSTAALRETPDAVYDLHRDYCDAGADVITAASYAVTRWYLGKIGKEHEVPKLARRAVELARRAVEDFMASPSSAATSQPSCAGHRRTPLVAASLPPLGESYQEAELSSIDMTQQYDELLVALSGADLFLCETMSTISEATLVASRCKCLYPKIPLWISFHPRRRTETEQKSETEDRGCPFGVCIARDGRSVKDAVNAAVLAGAEAVLFNCATPEIIGACIREAVIAAAEACDQKGCAIKVGGYGNFWEEADTAGWSIDRNESSEGAKDQKPGGFVPRDITPAQYAEKAQSWVGLGASVIGGCCGFGPETITAVGEHIGIGGHAAPKQQQ